MTEKKEEKKGTGVFFKYRKDGTPYAVVIAGDFPISKCEEWERDCKNNFSGCRWAKMMSDHSKAEAFDLLVKEKFKNQILEQQEEEPPEETILMGGDKLKQ